MFLNKSALLKSAIALAVMGHLSMANAAVEVEGSPADLAADAAVGLPELTDTFYLTAKSLTAFGNGLGNLKDASNQSLNTVLGTLKNNQEFDFKIQFQGFVAGDTTKESYNFTLSNVGFQLISATLGGVSEAVTNSNGFYTSQVTKGTITAANPYLEIEGTGAPTGTLKTLASLGGTDNIYLTPNNPVTPVPEPEQWAMLLLGLPMVSWMIRRKQVA